MPFCIYQPSAKRGKKMSTLFHTDGCIIANVRTRPFRVILARDCEHTKIIGAAIDITAESAEDAISYVTRWLKLPQTKVHRAYEIDPATVIGPPTE
jgi:hypothetical protein